MSNYSHDLKKAADTGLQLRLPVDLVPATQWSRFTNALPRIEGELRTRDGLTFVANIPQIAFTPQVLAIGLTTTQVEQVLTSYPNGFIVGDTVDVIIYSVIPGQAGPPVITPGTYTVTITGIITPTLFTFTPPIPATVNFFILIYGQVVSHDPLNILINTPITNLFRLNQAITGLSSDRIAVMAGRIYRAQLPAGNVFQELISPRCPNNPDGMLGFTNGLSGRPVSIIEFRFTRDTASWAIFADTQGMLKYRPGLTDDAIEFVPLGNAPPTISATATAGGAGNPNSTGGPGYDWRYTFVDGYTFTESNPSPISQTPGSAVTENATSTTNNGFTGVTLTGGTGNAQVTAGVSPQTQSVDCSWLNFTVPPGIIDTDVLTVTIAADAQLSTFGPGSGASFFITVSYSYDGGGSFHTLFSRNATIGSNKHQGYNYPSAAYTATLPSSISPANVIVKATVTAKGQGGPSGGEGDSNVDITVSAVGLNIQQEASTVTLALVNQIGRVCVGIPPFPQHKYINLYRRGGSLPDAWRLVGQFVRSTLSQGVCSPFHLEIDDNVSDATLSSAAILELDNDQPVTSVVIQNQPLSFIWGPVGVDARVLGCGDPARPECVYFSKPGNADAWPPQNFLEVSSPGTAIIAGCVYNNQAFAFSREEIFQLVEGYIAGATYTPFKTPSSHGLYAPQGLALGPAMYFIAKDGIYMSTGGQDVSLVENDIKPLFPTYDQPGKSVNGYEAVDYTQPDAMRLRYHNSELYFTYNGADTSTQQTLVYDILKKRWRAAQYSNGITESYSEPATTSSLLMGTMSGDVYVAGGPTDPSALDTMDNITAGPITTASSLAPATYYVRTVRYIAAGPMALSYDIAVVIGPGQGIQVTIPIAVPGTTKWRVFFGTTQGAENQYTEFTEAGLPLNRVVTITAAGTAGTVPTVNADNAIHGLARTGAHDQGVPLNRKQYGNVIFDLDPGGADVSHPITITPLINGEVTIEPAINVIGVGRQQAPLDLSDFFAFNTEYEISWTRNDTIDPVIFQYDTLTFLEPVGVTHWQAQPTSFGFPGFVHCRDAYIAIRSIGDVTLTVSFDTGGASYTTQTYNIPSTGGLRRKVYVQFASNKGLLYQFALDSVPVGGISGEFRVYEPDLELRVKPWLGVLGYAVMRVLGGEAGA